MNAKIIYNFKKRSPTILKVILAIISILYVWFVFFNTQLANSSETTNILCFSSFREWISGNRKAGDQIVKSFTILMPVGFLITAILYGTKWKEPNKFFLVTGLSFFLSVTQNIFLLKTFNPFKLITYTVGGCIGYWLYRLLQSLLDNIRKKWKGNLPRRRILSGWLCMLIGLLCLLIGADVKNDWDIVDSSVKISNVQLDPVNTFDPINREKKIDTNKEVGEPFKWEFVFQLDSVKTNNDFLVLEGFTFILNKDFEYYNTYKPEIVLRKINNSERIILETEYGIERQDVNNYFLCEYDYSKSGFSASISLQDIDKEEEYEVLIRFGNNITSVTSTYITDANIYYAPRDAFEAPKTEYTDLEIIVNNGKLRAYRPDQYCWIYQYDGFLYWIVEDGFSFDKTGYTLLPTHKSGYTHIPYHLRTTQIKKLPINTGDDMYNVDIFFEEQEITKDMNCGKYRVMREKLPSDFSISCIQTGVYINLSYVWVQYFWPYYFF